MNISTSRQTDRRTDIYISTSIAAPSQLTSIHGEFRKHSGSIQGAFKEHPGKIQGRFREGLRKVQGRFLTVQGRVLTVQGRFWEGSGKESS